ncbi:hypothetical protein HMPREF1988_00103, partial [Porphyromonas gingivalis F0185]
GCLAFLCFQEKFLRRLFPIERLTIYIYKTFSIYIQNEND